MSTKMIVTMRVRLASGRGSRETRNILVMDSVAAAMEEFREVLVVDDEVVDVRLVADGQPDLLLKLGRRVVAHDRSSIDARIRAADAESEYRQRVITLDRSKLPIRARRCVYAV